MLTYLALGDSYTIGEKVDLTDSFPYQLVQLLRKHNFTIAAPEIIAKTGFTTDELKTAIAKHVFQKEYDIITLLIGVNNQYRGRSVKEFSEEFEWLLLKALSFKKASGKLIVLSIPDWGVTPFAADRDKNKIAGEIDLYNDACKNICAANNITFIDITVSQRKDNSPDFLAEDGLHPSAMEYRKWATALCHLIG
jgi:lysophospholipase L1-like esterase